MITSKVQHVILYLLALGVSSLMNRGFIPLAHFSTRLSFSNRLMWIIYIFKLLNVYMFINVASIFSHAVYGRFLRRGVTQSNLHFGKIALAMVWRIDGGDGHTWKPGNQEGGYYSGQGWMMVAWTRVVGNKEKWPVLEYILEGELAELTERLAVGWEEKRNQDDS